MSPEEKAPFKEQARADFARYHQQRVKSLAIQEKYEHRELNSRCAPNRVRRLFKKFDEAKKEAVRSLGFASWLDIGCGKIDHKLCLFILDKIKVPRFALELNSQSVLLTPEQVGYMFRVAYIWPDSLECALGAKDAVVDAGFKEKIVLFLLATVFCPTTSLKIPMGYLHVIKDIDRVNEYNWALFVFNKLQDGVIEYKLHGNKAYICGCIYFLQVLFYDKVVAGLRVLPLSKRPPIRLSVWTQRRVKLLQHYLKRQGGYNKAKLLGTDDDHPTKNEKEAKKEEKKKSHVIDDGSKVEQHNKAEGIILEELREDVKCMKLQLTALTGLVTETMHKGVASMITELLTTLKSDILQEIAKGTTPSVPNTPFAQQGDPNTPSTHQGVHNTPSTNQGVHNTPSTHQGVHNTPSTHQGQGDPNSPLAHNGLFDFPSLEISGVVLKYSDFQTQAEYLAEKKKRQINGESYADPMNKGKQQPVRRQPVQKVRR
uniref:Aminotransferase-like plant mobile domain-containing protein n=1 Tax=Fagus sylvatica TaxID=28930 RepID=A0A2N9EEQ5_FAGSY